MPVWKRNVDIVKRICLRVGLAAVMALSIDSAGIARQISCDSLYYMLQDLTVNHIRGNEVWVEYFLDCSGDADTIGGFILSEVGQEGLKDRAVIAGYDSRRGWQYRFGERGPNIHFVRPSPLIDIDGDGELDITFAATSRTFPTERDYLVLFVRDGKRENSKLIPLERDMAIDSILPAAPGSAHPLQIIDRRCFEIGGLTYDKAPRSYRYYVWDAASDPPAYADRTASHTSQFPIFRQRESFVRALPATGELAYESEEEYAEFLINIIGYCFDQSNIGRELAGFEEVNAILERVRYKGSTERLSSPRSVIVDLRRILPEVKQLQQKNRSGN